jgi:hypothetical protein
MIALVCFVLAILTSPFKSRSRLEAENAALRHQLIVLRRKLRGRAQLTSSDRWFFVHLYRWFPSILQVFTIARPETLVGWHRAGFAAIGVGNHKDREGDRPPSQGWRTFLRNHAPDIAAMDLFVVPTIGFKLLYGFVIVRLDRKDLVWINVTTNPTAEWVARQITEAFPWDGAGSGIAIGTPSSGLRRLRKWPSALCDPCIPHGVIRFQHRRKINCGSPSQALTPYFFRFLWCRRIGMMPTDHLFPRGARQQCATANQ